MDVATLTETWGTMAGFIGQGVARQVMWGITISALLVGTVLAAAKHGISVRPLNVPMEVMRYFTTSMLLIVLFQPELFRMASITAPEMNASDVTSFVASENGGTLQTAADFATNRGIELGNVRVPYLVGVFTTGAAQATEAIGKTISEAASRPGATAYELSTFAQYRLPNRLHLQIEKWVHKCVLPAKAELSSENLTYTEDDLRVVPGSALWDVMSGMRRPLGRGVLNLAVLVENCGTVGSRLYTQAIAAINTDQTPSGRAFGAVWSEDLGISTQDAAEHFIERAVNSAQGEAVPPPSMMGRYLGVQTLSALNLNSLKSGAKKGGVLGVIGSILGGGAINTVGDALEGLKSIIAIGLYFNNFFPVVLGVVQAAVQLSLPVMLLWSLSSPGHQFRPIGIWITGVVISNLGPVVFGLMGLMGRLFSAQNINFSTDAPHVWMFSHVGLILIHSSGLFIFLFLAGAIGLGSYAIANIGKGF